MKTRLLDVPIDAVSVEEALARMEGFIRSGRPHQVATVNLDFLRHSRANPEFRRLLNEADLVVPDGAPVVWALRLRGCRPQRVTGVELIEGCAHLSQEKGYRLFFLGGPPGAAEATIETLRGRYPRLRVAGSWAPTVADDGRIVDGYSVRLIREAQPDCLFVAFGCPKQDFWIRTHKRLLGVPVSIGVGGSFSLLGGIVPRAPRWMQRAGLEWLHRLIQEPGRLWQRYLVHDLRLVPALFFDAVSGRWAAERTVQVDGYAE